MNPTLDAILDALADALVEKIAERLPGSGAKETYTVEQLAERYGMSRASIQYRIRAGEFGETINTGKRTHLVTAEGVRQYEAAHTGPAHAGRVYKTKTGGTAKRDPGPI